MVNKLLLAGDKFISEIHLGQPGFACSACGTFFKKQSKNTKKLKKQQIHDIFIKISR